MKHKILRSLIIAIVCLLVGVVLIVVNYTLDNSGGKGYSGTMNTLEDYHRSLGMVVGAIGMAAASVFMMSLSIVTFMRKRQARDEEILRQLDEEEAKAQREMLDKKE